MYKCKKCGSENIQIKMWVGANSNVPEDGVSDGETEDNWCPDCDSHCEIVDSEDEEKFGTVYLNVSLHFKDPLTTEQVDDFVSNLDYEFKHESLDRTELNGWEFG